MNINMNLKKCFVLQNSRGHRRVHKNTRKAEKMFTETEKFTQKITQENFRWFLEQNAAIKTRCPQ